MSHKILIVDDESENLRALERLFRGSYNVLTAESGAEALALLEQHDVALLDRKSTRLNSSHITISYAVFCLKKKKGKPNAQLKHFNEKRTFRMKSLRTVTMELVSDYTIITIITMVLHSIIQNKQTLVRVTV